MGLTEKLLGTFKNMVALDSEVKTLVKRVEKMDDKLGDVDKRVVRLEAVADIMQQLKNLTHQ